MKKKILIFSLTYFPFVGGAEVAVKEITDRLPDFEFVMLTVNLDGKQATEEKIGDVLVRRIGSGKKSKYFFPFSALKEARELHKKNHYDAIWAIMANQAGLAALFFKWNFPKVKYLLTLQEGDSEWDIWVRTWFMRPLYKMIYRQADYIQAISGFLSGRAKKMGAECPIETIPNGVDVARFRPPAIIDVEHHKKELKKKMDLSFDSKIIITASRLVPKNNIRDLVQAIRFLPEDYYLFIVGSGILKKDIMIQIIAANLQKRVSLFGEVGHELLPAILWASDVFCRPSLSEGLGNAFLEAMAAGLPVVGTNVGGIPDFLKTGETGLFCRLDDPKDIADKIKMIFDDPELAKKLIQNGQEITRPGGRYDWATIVPQMKNIFDKLCES